MNSTEGGDGTYDGRLLWGHQLQRRGRVPISPTAWTSRCGERGEGGLVDTLIPYSSGPALSSAEKSWTNVRDIDYFVSRTGGTPCKLAPNVLPRVQSPKSFREMAARLHAAGVEYLFFWDCDPRFRAQYGPHWNTLRGLGHRDGIASWVRAGMRSLETPSKPLRKLGDWDLSYDTPD